MTVQACTGECEIAMQICVWMCVCPHVCRCVCLPGCMHVGRCVCMYNHPEVDREHGLYEECIRIRMKFYLLQGGCMYVCMHACNAYVSVRVCMHVSLRTYIHQYQIYIHENTHIHVRVLVYLYTCTYTCIHMYLYVHVVYLVCVCARMLSTNMYIWVIVDDGTDAPRPGSAPPGATSHASAVGHPVHADQGAVDPRPRPGRPPAGRPALRAPWHSVVQEGGRYKGTCWGVPNLPDSLRQATANVGQQVVPASTQEEFQFLLSLTGACSGKGPPAQTTACYCFP